MNQHIWLCLTQVDEDTTNIREALLTDNMTDAVMWINDAILQLESVKSALQAKGDK